MGSPFRRFGVVLVATTRSLYLNCKTLRTASSPKGNNRTGRIQRHIRIRDRDDKASPGKVIFFKEIASQIYKPFPLDIFREIFDRDLTN